MIKTKCFKYFDRNFINGLTYREELKIKERGKSKHKQENSRLKMDSCVLIKFSNRTKTQISRKKTSKNLD